MSAAAIAANFRVSISISFGEITVREPAARSLGQTAGPTICARRTAQPERVAAELGSRAWPLGQSRTGQPAENWTG
jgi:hypothetical protein